MRLMRLEEVSQTVGLGRTSIYKLIGEGAFPKPINVSGRAVRWISDEIEAWIRKRVDERDGEKRQRKVDECDSW